MSPLAQYLLNPSNRRAHAALLKSFGRLTAYRRAGTFDRIAALRLLYMNVRCDAVRGLGGEWSVAQRDRAAKDLLAHWRSMQ